MNFGKFLIPSSLFAYYLNKAKKFSFCEKDSQINERRAICILNPEQGQTARGVVRFVQPNFDAKTTVEAKFTGLKQNSRHGFHIHEFGDLSQGCTTAGPHFNPFGKTHGDWEGEERHVGDLGNLESDENGNANYKRDVEVSLMGNYSVIGRSCVVHENQDDLGKGNFEDSKTTGHSGPRIACGIIGMASSKSN